MLLVVGYHSNKTDFITVIKKILQPKDDGMRICYKEKFQKAIYKKTKNDWVLGFGFCSLEFHSSSASHCIIYFIPNSFAMRKKFGGASPNFFAASVSEVELSLTKVKYFCLTRISRSRKDKIFSLSKLTPAC